MNILITGGAGSLGSYLAAAWSRAGHRLRIVDRDPQALGRLGGLAVERVAGDLADRAFAERQVEDCEAVVHLAWSFSDDIRELFQTDLQAQLNLLESAARHHVGVFINASTAVVYGKPLHQPVDEEHPLLPERARKPAYGVAKLAAEKLCLYFAREKGLAATTLRIWWAFAEDIGGRHIRDMIRSALKGEALQVPSGSGGTLLHLADFAAACDAVLQKRPAGASFNLGTVYLTWEEIARLIARQANPAAPVRVVDRAEWQGAEFLADDWRFSLDRIERELGFRSAFPAGQAKEALGQAIGRRTARIRAAG
jgi:UDP-glucose 4-epimerase